MIARVTKRIKRSAASLAQKRREYMAKRPHRSLRKTPRRRVPHPPMVSVPRNVMDTLRTIWQEKKLLLGLAVIYLIFIYVLVGGIAQTDFADLKQATVETFGGHFNSLGTAFSLLTSTMSGAFSTPLTELQQFLQALVAVFFWLAFIWALRMRSAGQKVKIRDALYNSGAPLFSYIVVGVIIAVQLIPAGLALFVYSVAQAGGYLHAGIEIMLFALAAILLACLSLYWLSGSLLALVVVTLPQMYPWAALSASSELVIGRRVRLMTHILGLGVSLFLIWVVILLPAILLDSWLRVSWLPIVPFVVQCLGAFTLVYFSTYVYKLYRSLL